MLPLLLAGDCGKEEDILWNESQDTETQICGHSEQTDGCEGPSYSAV